MAYFCHCEVTSRVENPSGLEITGNVTQEQIKNARGIRRRRVRERQAVVFGVLAATLGATGLWALGVYQGAIALPFDKGFTYEAEMVDTVYPVACLPNDTKPIGAKKISINVLNASSQAGVAGSVRDQLKERKMKVESVGNAPALRATTAIVYGPEGLVQAYTLSAHLGNPALILDDTKEGTTIDLQLGADYKSLIKREDVQLSSDEAMNSRLDCQDLWELTDKVEPPEDTSPDLEEEEPEEEEDA